MMRLVMLLGLAVCFGCSVATSAATEPDTVLVNVVSACTPQSLPGAVGEVVGSDGLVRATTVAGVDGALRIRRQDLRDAAYLVVCHPGYVCGVLKLTDRAGQISNAIVLAPEMAVQTLLLGAEPSDP